MTVSHSRTENESTQNHNLFPLYVFLGRLVSDVAVQEVGMHIQLLKLNQPINLCLLDVFYMQALFCSFFYILISDYNTVLEKKKYSATYRFSRACILNNSTGEGSGQIQANFILPDINKLAVEAKSGSVAILLVSFGMHNPLFQLIWSGLSINSHKRFISYYFLAVGAQNPLYSMNQLKGPLDIASLPCKISL